MVFNEWFDFSRLSAMDFLLFLLVVVSCFAEGLDISHEKETLSQQQDSKREKERRGNEGIRRSVAAMKGDECGAL